VTQGCVQASTTAVWQAECHVSRAMLEHYSRIRTDAKRATLERLVQVNFCGCCEPRLAPTYIRNGRGPS